MKKIIWKDEFNTNIDEIDKQHRFLVNRINELIELKIMKEESANLYPILLLLVGYAQFHFEYEENLWAKLEVSDLAEHIEEHKKFSIAIDNFNELYINGTRDIDDELLIFLNRWWTNHILEKDLTSIKNKV